jgi:hypothetical protein
MDRDGDFDRTWWDIETLLTWIGGEESAGLDEIEKHAERLGLTGQLGSLYSGFGTLRSREAIPELEFADCVLQKVNGRYVYLSNPDTRGSPLAGWQHLRLRADKAKMVWSRSQAAPPETHPGNNERPAADPVAPPARKSHPKKTKREAVSEYMVRTYPQGIPPGVSDKHIAAELRKKNIASVSERTIQRARRGT